MPSVYLDPSTLVLAADDAAGPRPVPGAADALRSLRDAVDDVVVLSDAPVPIDLPDGVRVQPAISGEDRRTTWFVTADGETTPPGGVTTMLVGPRRMPGHLPLTRFDVEARDLSAAVIEILTREAMR